MSDNPLESSPARDKLIEKRARELMAAENGAGSMEDYRERADELVRMEMAGKTGQMPIEKPERIDEASIQDNLGEFPGGSSIADQGEHRETPMTREGLKNPE